MTEDERREILRLVADGKMTADEAARLLSGAAWKNPEANEEIASLKESESAPEQSSVLKERSNRPSWLHVHVSDIDTGKSKVTVNVPLQLVKYGLSIGSRFSPEVAEVDWDDLTSMISQEKGMLVDVQDDEDGERVQIYVD